MLDSIIRDPHDRRKIFYIIFAVAFIALMSYLIYTGVQSNAAYQRNVSILNETHPNPVTNTNTTKAYNQADLSALFISKAALSSSLGAQYNQTTPYYLLQGQVPFIDANANEISTVELSTYPSQSNKSAITSVTIYIVQFFSAAQANSSYTSAVAKAAFLGIRTFNYSGYSYVMADEDRVLGNTTDISLAGAGLYKNYIFYESAFGASNVSGADTVQFNNFNALTKAELTTIISNAPS